MQLLQVILFTLTFVSNFMPSCSLNMDFHSTSVAKKKDGSTSNLGRHLKAKHLHLYNQLNLPAPLPSPSSKTKDIAAYFEQMKQVCKINGISMTQLI